MLPLPSRSPSPPRLREAHRQAVTIALTELERYTEARITYARFLLV
jgi:hypothetical protein